MIKSLEISTIHTEVDEDLKKYARKKISKLDAYMPKHARKSAKVEITLKEAHTKTRKQYTVEVLLTVPGEIITAKETTKNMYAAIDIVEEKLKAQLRRYKTTKSAKNGRKDIMVRAFLGKIVPKRRKFKVQ
jgi:putative sigma-54 modulation protein